MVENKADLLDEDNREKTQDLEEFAERNGFCGYFRTSAKTGLNINESVEFLIDEIIQRMEFFEEWRNQVFSSEKKSDSLEPEKNNEISKETKNKDNKSKNNKNCSFKDHQDIEAKGYCLQCQVYLCKECLDYHKGLFDNHQINSLDTLTGQIFTGFCQEKNHNIKLEYYCKTHNQLCCGLCICKMKGIGNGQHNDCDVCLIKDIKEEKQNMLKDNIETLEEFSNELKESIKDLRLIFKKVTKNKEQLRAEVQEIFKKIRTELNERENKLLLEVDTYFDNNYCNEDLINKCNKLESSLKKGKLIEKGWEDDNKLNKLINDCINIENNLKDINSIKEYIIKYNENKKFNFHFNNDVNNFIIDTKNFGCLSNFDSLIIKNQNDFDKFNNLIENDKISNNMNLLYRSSRDGFDYINIVNKVNNKSNLIFLYLTGKDRVFGAYIEVKLENIDLNGTRKYYKDENAFAFSINNNKKYKILEPKNAIGFDKEKYILIGNNNNENGFYYYKNVIYDELLINETKIYDFSKNCELTEGFGKLNELEIFEIIIS